MECSSLSIKEEKAQLVEMKLMKSDNKKLLDWESEMDDNRNRRSHLAEQLRIVYDQLDQQKNVQWKTEVAQKLGTSQDDLTDMRLPVSEGMQELLSSPLWKKKLQNEYSVFSKMDRGSNRAVRLTGKQEAVEAAAKLIGGFGPVEVLRMEIDEEQQGLLIGKRGSTIAQLQESTGCALDIRKNTSMLHIVGPAQPVEDAQAMILEMLTTQVLCPPLPSA